MWKPINHLKIIMLEVKTALVPYLSMSHPTNGEATDEAMPPMLAAAAAVPISAAAVSSAAPAAAVPAAAASGGPRATSSTSSRIGWTEAAAEAAEAAETPTKIVLEK